MEEVKKKRGRPRKVVDPIIEEIKKIETRPNQGYPKVGEITAVVPTEKQKNAVINVLSGKYPSIKSAMKAAGYSRQMGWKKFVRQDGVRVFLKYMDEAALTKYGKTVAEKIMDVYMDALSAEKIVGRHDMRIEDHRTRVEVASKLAEVMQITKPVQQTVINNTTNEQKNIQYNYFSTPQEDKKAFTKSFIDFVNNYKKPAGSDVGAREGIAKREVEEGEVAN